MLTVIKLSVHLSYDHPSLSSLQGQMNMYDHTKTRGWMSLVALLTVDPDWKDSECLPTGIRMHKLWYIHQGGSIHQQEGTLLWFRQQHRWIEKIMCWPKEVRHRITHTVWFYLNEILKKVKVIHIERKRVSGCLMLESEGVFGWWKCSVSWFGGDYVGV